MVGTSNSCETIFLDKKWAKWENGKKWKEKKNYSSWSEKKKHKMIIGLTLFVIMVIVLILIIKFAPSNTNSNNVEISTNAISRALDNEFVTVTLQGGLGNQMFQIATAMAYAEKTNKKFIMNTNVSELIGLSTRKTYWNKIHVEHDLKIDTYNWKEIKEANFAFNELHVEPGNVKLTGYFQSARYFSNQRDAIIRKFVQVEALDNIMKDTVSVHIRRTDYIGLNFYAELNEKYYQSAIQYIQSSRSLTLVVFSDDLDWVKKSGWFNEYKVQYCDVVGDFEQLIAMSQCEHHVMANSSYSWWAVYLGNQTGITVAPKQWFLDSNINTNDLYLPNWIEM